MNTNDTQSDDNQEEPISMSRREVFKTLGTAAAAAAMGIGSAAQAAEQVKDASSTGAANPYGGGPNTGITLPPYYRPTPSVANANNYFPGMEELGGDEMRISFVGSSADSQGCKSSSRTRTSR